MKGKFEFKNENCYEMPVQFRNYPFVPNYSVIYGDCFNLTIQQKTDINMLAEYIPSCFELLEGRLYWAYCDCRDVDFMAGGNYRILQATAPVSYTKKDGSVLYGVYPLFILEDRFEPIVGGREKCGMPKTLCDISTEHHMGNHYFVNASSRCYPVVEMDMFKGEEIPMEALNATRPKEPLVNFGYRCLPNLGKGGCDFHQVIAYPQSAGVTKAWAATGEVTIYCPKPEHWYKSSYFGTMARMKALPNLGYENGMITKSALNLNVTGSYIVE